MKFGDVVTAVASLAVISVLISFPMGMVLFSASDSSWAIGVTGGSTLLSALIVGYIFAGRIWEEDRMEAIAKITVLSAALPIFFVAMQYGTYIAPWQYAAYFNLWVFSNMVIVLVLGFIGLYVGSMLRRPAKS